MRRASAYRDRSPRFQIQSVIYRPDKYGGLVHLSDLMSRFRHRRESDEDLTKAKKAVRSELSDDEGAMHDLTDYETRTFLDCVDDFIDLLPIQAELKSQEQWDNAMDRLGLLIVDAYSAWCGPCKAIVSLFRRIKNEIGDDYLNFATAETDSIESLKLYRGKSRPTFLFYGSGTLVKVIRGCNGPLLERSIRSLLETEHKAIKGEGERIQFIDPEVKVPSEEKIDIDKAETSENEKDDEEIVEVPKEVTVAIIKPDAVREGKVDFILEKLAEAGIEVLHKEERLLTREEAAEFYKQQEGMEHFEQLIDFMSSGPCVTLVLSKEGETAGYGVIPEFRNLLGPKDVNVAKEEAPTSLRAQFGTDQIQNAIHGCDSHESAARELAFFFPNFNVPTVTEKKKKKELQRTLALVRPSALSRKDSILRKIEEAGFVIAMAKEMRLTREQVEDFYSEHKEQPYFEHLVDNMTCGPSLALCLAREDAVEVWRNMLGPKDVAVAKNEAPDSMRAVFADDEADINPIHGADSVHRADEEINKLFPKESTVAVIKPEIYNEPNQRELVISKIEEAGFNISAQKEVVLTKELAAQFYHEHSGKDFFNQLTDYMSSGPTLFLVLSREDAIDGFRSLMGPTDPDEAKASFPSSLRAQIAQDLMKNGVHGSSNKEKARQIIAEYFPELEVKDDGSVATSQLQEGLAEEVVEQSESDNLEAKGETADQNNNTNLADETVRGQETEEEGGQSAEAQKDGNGAEERDGENVNQPESDLESNAQGNDSKEIEDNITKGNETEDNNADTAPTDEEQQSTGETKAETEDGNTGETKTETEGDNTGEAKTETEDGNTGEAKTETEDDNTGEAETETEDGNTGEAKTETEDGNTGEAKTETEDDNTGEAKTETEDGNTGEAKTETEDGNTGEAKTETEDGNTGESKTETEDGNTGEAKTETEDGNTGEAKTETEDGNSGEVDGGAMEGALNQTVPTENDPGASSTQESEQNKEQEEDDKRAYLNFGNSGSD